MPEKIFGPEFPQAGNREQKATGPTEFEGWNPEKYEVGEPPREGETTKHRLQRELAELKFFNEDIDKIVFSNVHKIPPECKKASEVMVKASYGSRKNYFRQKFSELSKDPKPEDLENTPADALEKIKVEIAETTKDSLEREIMAAWKYMEHAKKTGEQEDTYGLLRKDVLSRVPIEQKAHSIAWKQAEDAETDLLVELKNRFFAQNPKARGGDFWNYIHRLELKAGTKRPPGIIMFKS
ncbi:hypothetical protein C4553_03280 [Candidatus Parcubacteria bacterium]|nr:MAG: hypothetical protein C4553_03280 [Candidatus Parcubacteria bacterium]